MNLQARNLTPALSVAGAICDHLHDWVLGTPEGTWVSMGVASDGSYGVPENLYFSFPFNRLAVCKSVKRCRMSLGCHKICTGFRASG